ncbi:Poly(A) polymeras-like protein [Mytilinidion resinicola]|uniref:Poly(A) polymerase n=1 Tax=Mytilinidion resinicola TaxID=574789 RepID=A0A6A6Z6G8_9PEZI|nr:Poly(A) polymeras-like protein [Mytilinidion resinicola]KAF2815857.1 Poly(A) polymeras-like protein [Mytilinidion resinicola]
MDGQVRERWGITEPVSKLMPDEKDLEVHRQLIEELKRQNNFESQEATDRRVKVLNLFQKVTEDFVRIVGKAKGLSQSAIDSAGGKIFTFGSYRLGVYGPGSDIDTLVVAPRHVTFKDFFEHFPPCLEKHSKPGDIEELTPVPDAHVPIIKIEYCGISIDLIFAALPSASIKLSLELTEKNILRGLDETMMRSVNGTRVTDELLQLIPQAKTFRHATRAIKLWAQRRGIYGNVFGFPGGVAWAMMVARICQLYPYACGATIAVKFFSIYAEWPWPRPVLLKVVEDGALGLKVWNPQIYRGDKQHLMPIITPAFPSMCATHNVTHSTKSVIMKELERGKSIASLIYTGKKSWHDLFERHTFFTKDYKYYLSIISASRTKEEQNMWSGWVQSRLRLLVKGIDESDSGVEVAHPYYKAIERFHRCKTQAEKDRVLSGSVEFVVKEEDKSADEREPAKTADGDSANDAESITIYTNTHYIGLKLREEGAKKLDISFPVSDFKRLVTSSTSYDEDKNAIRVVHTRSYDLPLDLFEEGEVRPVRVKRVKAKPVKRSFADTGIDVRTILRKAPVHLPT